MSMEVISREEAISHIKYMIKAYQNLIKNDVRSGDAIGKDIKGEWKSEKTLADAYMQMIESLNMAIQALEQKPCEDTDIRLIHTQGLDEGIRCAMCTNPMANDRGCDGSCIVNDRMYKRVMKVIEDNLVEQEPCEDCISRQAVLDLATTLKTDDYSGNEILEVVEVDDIKKMPPVNPQEPKTDIRECKNCKYSKDGHMAGTEKCHECMWESKQEPKQGHWDDKYIPISWLREKLNNHPELSYSLTDSINNVLDLWLDDKEN